ncbi:hypothetical protein BJ508DRAFT_313805 [Ascobolus immersus RN42]|uniref:Uncharacterized protein n=1 Tax=Ascobolus immersus RN42 TaxID=1160509 RepID=A0A3N4HLN7_ASCIM|nr:hypothetical protein BJ508DRAFT_313805 [Ascobolus immersus RN42]
MEGVNELLDSEREKELAFRHHQHGFSAYQASPVTNSSVNSSWSLPKLLCRAAFNYGHPHNTSSPRSMARTVPLEKMDDVVSTRFPAQIRLLQFGGVKGSEHMSLVMASVFQGGGTSTRFATQVELLEFGGTKEFGEMVMDMADVFLLQMQDPTPHVNSSTILYSAALRTQPPIRLLQQSARYFSSSGPLRKPNGPQTQGERLQMLEKRVAEEASLSRFLEMQVGDLQERLREQETESASYRDFAEKRLGERLWSFYPVTIALLTSLIVFLFLIIANGYWDMNTLRREIIEQRIFNNADLELAEKEKKQKLLTSLPLFQVLPFQEYLFTKPGFEAKSTAAVTPSVITALSITSIAPEAGSQSSSHITLAPNSEAGWMSERWANGSRL